MRVRILHVGYFRDISEDNRTDDNRMSRALERAGAEVLRCESPWNDLEALVDRTSPDWVLFSKCHELGCRRVARLRNRSPRPGLAQVLNDLMVHWDHRLPGIPWLRRTRLSWWAPMARHFDIVFLRERGHVARYEQMGIHAVYLDQGCDPEEEPATSFPASTACDVAFFGVYYPSRAATLAALQPNRRVLVYAVRPERWRRAGLDVRPAVFGAQFAEAVAGASIVYGESVRHDVEGYWSDRVYRVLGHKGFFLTPYTPGFETFFRNGEHLVWSERRQDLAGLVDRYLGDDAGRRRIAEAGFRHVREHHSYDHRARELLAVLERTPRRP